MNKATCKTCYSILWWQDCPTGGWWIHDVHPSDHHDGNPGWEPAQDMDDAGELYTIEPPVRIPT